MPSLQEIKARIGAIKKIKKITKAMQLVATAKLVKAKQSLDQVAQFSSQVRATFNKALKAATELDKLFQTKAPRRDLYIVITSDLGLCGSYNSNIIKITRANIKPVDQIITVGLKGKIAFKKQNNKIANYTQIGDVPNYLVASEITKIVMAKFWENDIQKVKVIHTRYVNALTYNPMVTKVLPLDTSFVRPKVLEYELEPNANVVVKNGLPLYVASIIYELLTESKLAEITSRRTAMENASDNADELIENLDLEYNQARQAKITQEISEIVVGSEGK